MTRTPLTALSLCACLLAGPALAAPQQAEPADTIIQGLDFDAKTGQFTEVQAPDGGWQAFARLLQKAAPSANTAIPLTPSQVTARIARLIDDGKAQDALKIITLQEQARKRSGAIGTDVQLEYQRGRALDALGEHDQALAVWLQMTRDFPELPEPWNALAVEYAGRGQLELAQEALQTALASVPDFAPALENLGQVQLRLAEESFAKARAAKNPAAATSPPSNGR